MKRRLFSLGALVALTLATALPAHATVADVLKCRQSIAKGGYNFAKNALKQIQKCNGQNLKTPGTCTTLSTTIDALKAKDDTAIDKGCLGFSPSDALTMKTPFDGPFPGKCLDATPSDGFDSTELHDCMKTSHEDIVDKLIQLEYGSTVGPITDTALLKCQAEIAKDGAKVTAAVLKAVQNCRNKLDKGKLTGFQGADCATADPTTALAITKAESKADAKIRSKCTSNDQIAQLDVCEPTKALTIDDAVSCIISSHHRAADDPVLDDPADLIDFEYSTPPVCGDGVVNGFGSEECDGSDVSGCVAQGFAGPCGAPSGSFACLCLDIPRERVIEHKEADLDNGWTGDSHNSGVVEGGGYVSDLYDCDNVSDFDCTVGPSCSGAPHAPCFNDAQCAALSQGTCRKRITSVGPHCAFDVQQACPAGSLNSTLGLADFCDTQQTDPCLKQFHGAPLPLVGGGVAVCVINIFKEDVVGTKNLTSGASAVRLRQASVTYFSTATGEPCPVCGGFCNNNFQLLCSSDADCGGGVGTCNLTNVCSIGPNAGKTCRADPPYGGPTQFFGNPSVDCPPGPHGGNTDPRNGGTNISGQGLDILFNPATTSSTSMRPTVTCDSPGLTNNRCAGGSNNGRTCASAGDCPGSSCIGGPNSGSVCSAASECPGGSCTAAICTGQCFCPTGGGLQEKPNSCQPACVGGGNDAGNCAADSDCPGGFCHPADCRPDPTAPAFKQPNEGVCTTGPTVGRCSVSNYKTCSMDSNCTPAGGCPGCQPSETCVFKGQTCFINDALVREGAPDPVNPRSASAFCIAAVTAGSVNSAAGLPGPGALLQPETIVDTGF